MQQLAQELFEEASKRGFTSTQEAFDDLSFASDPAIQPLIEKTAKLMEQFSGASPPSGLLLLRKPSNALHQLPPPATLALARLTNAQ